MARRYPHGYALVDVETTGLDPVGDRIVQVAVAHLSADGVLQRTWSTLLDPGCDPGPVEVHGLTRQHLAGAPQYATVAGELGRLLEDRVLVAHNATFDWRFLAAEAQRVDRPLPVRHRLCTVALTRHLDLPVTSLSLTSVAAYLGVVQARPHDAIDDIRVLAEILLKLLIAADRVDLALPLIACNPSDAARVYPARTLRRTCHWSNPGKWVRGQALVQGMTVAITGQTTVPRDVLSSRATDAGLDVVNTVSGRTSLLVTNDLGSTTAKTRNAAKHRVPIVNEAQFIGLLNDVRGGVAQPQAASPPPTPAAFETATPRSGSRPIAAPRVTAPRVTAPSVTAPSVTAPRVTGPLSGRCLLVLGGRHADAAEARTRISALGGIAAVNLTARVTHVVALPGADKQPRWARVAALGIPICDPETFEPIPDVSGGAPSITTAQSTDQPATPPNEPASPAATPALGTPAAVLPRGGVVDLPDDRRNWSISVTWPASTDATPVEVDVVAFLTGHDEQVHADADFVFYNAPASADGSVELTLDIPTEALIDIRLDRIPDDVQRVILAAALPERRTFGDIGPVELVARTDTGVAHIRATLDAATTEQSLLLACIYRRHHQWRFRAIGQGYEHGLAELATTHGVTVDD